MEHGKKLMILNGLVTGSFWCSFGLACSAIGDGDWVTQGDTSYGLFRTCDPTCQRWETAEPSIIGARGLLVSAIVVGFFGWNFAFTGYKTKQAGTATISIALFSLASILNLIGMSVWTAYIANTYPLLTGNFDFGMYWASVGVMFLAIMFSILLTFALRSVSATAGC